MMKSRGAAYETGSRFRAAICACASVAVWAQAPPQTRCGQRRRRSLRAHVPAGFDGSAYAKAQRHSGADHHLHRGTGLDSGRDSLSRSCGTPRIPLGVTIDPEPGRVTPRGSRRLTPTATTTYTLTVRGPNNQVLTKAVTVTVAGTVAGRGAGAGGQETGAANGRWQTGFFRRLHGARRRSGTRRRGARHQAQRLRRPGRC